MFPIYNSSGIKPLFPRARHPTRQHEGVLEFFKLIYSNWRLITILWWFWPHTAMHQPRACTCPRCWCRFLTSVHNALSTRIPTAGAMRPPSAHNAHSDFRNTSRLTGINQQPRKTISSQGTKTTPTRHKRFCFSEAILNYDASTFRTQA